MKKITHIILSAVLVVATSCSGLLEEHPTTSYTEKSVFQTESSLEAQMYGLYRSTYSAIASTVMFYNFACSSLLIHWKTVRSGTAYEQLLRGTLYAEENQGKTILGAQFSAIQNYNLFIKGLEDSPVDAKVKKELEAEARLLRAIVYFYSVRMFGDVPLYTKPVSSDQDSYVKRTSFKLVYAQIVEDLKYAFDNMRTESTQIKQNGRAYNYAAKAFLAEVYLQIGTLLASPDDQAFGTLETGEVKPEFSNMGITSAEQAFDLALEAADDVIANGPYDLENDFRDLYVWDSSVSENSYFSKERVFVMQNNVTGGTAAVYTQHTLPNFLLGTKQGETLTSCNVCGYTRPFRMVLDKWAKTYGGNTRTDASGTVYTSCNDPRYAATYLSEYYVTGKSTGKYAEPLLTQVYPAANKDDAYFLKYFCPQYDADAGEADYYVMRLAEMYLVAAEACAQTGKSGLTGDAYDYIEVLHSRARVSKDGSASSQPKWTKGQFATKDELVTAIFWESIFETHGEGHEWFNSHRHGATWMVNNLYEPIDKFLKASEQTDYKKYYWYDKGYETPRTVHNARCGLLCDYPQYELLYNQALTSNDQNFFHSKKAVFSVTGNASETNEDYDNEEDIFNW